MSVVAEDLAAAVTSGINCGRIANGVVARFGVLARSITATSISKAPSPSVAVAGFLVGSEWEEEEGEEEEASLQSFVSAASRIFGDWQAICGSRRALLLGKAAISDMTASSSRAAAWMALTMRLQAASSLSALKKSTAEAI